MHDLACCPARRHETRDVFTNRESPGAEGTARGLSMISRKKKKRERSPLQKGKLPTVVVYKEMISSEPVVRVAILGFHRVGKSALAVRHITNRFIGDYGSGEESYFCRESKLGLSYELVVRSPTLSEETLDLLKKSVDGVLVVYDVTSRESFNFASTLLESLGRERSSTPSDPPPESPNLSQDPLHATRDCETPLSDEDGLGGLVFPSITTQGECVWNSSSGAPSIPIAVVGNKRDLEHRREVTVEEGQKLSLEAECNFLEISTAESTVGPNLALRLLLREIISSYRRWPKLENEKSFKSSQFPLAPHPDLEFPETRSRRKQILSNILYENEGSGTLSSISSSGSSTCSSCNSCSSNENHKLTNSKEPSRSSRHRHKCASVEHKGLWSDVRSTIGNIFGTSLSRKSGRKIFM